MSATRRRLTPNRTTLLAVLAFGLVLGAAYWTQAQQQPEPPVPPEPPTTTTRPPFIIQNQFNTTSSGSLHARSPGLMVQAGIAEATGQVVVEGNSVQPVPGFIADTLELLFLQLIDEITAFIQSLATLVSGGGPVGGVNLGDLGGLIPSLDNPLTNGNGGSVPIQ